MLETIDLRQLAELTGPERAFVSLYLSGPEALQSLDNRIAKVRGLLAGEPAEVEHFEENLKRIRELLAGIRFDSPSLCVFSCWALDYLEHFPLAVAGPEDVLEAAQYGRVETMIVTRDAQIAGTQCRDCEELAAGERTACPECGSESVFKVDLVNELAQILALTGASAEFADPLPGLSEVGDVAALLRY